MFYGSIPALITPFKNGAVDYSAFEKFVAWQIEQGSHGLVPCGTTGESPTLTDDEMKTLFSCTVSIVKNKDKRIPIIAGTGSNSTSKAIFLSQQAQKCNVDALLIVTPYYNKPTQEGLFAHYQAIHDATDLPIILYNVLGRCGVELSAETICRLAELPRIAGLKDATADLTRTNFIKARVKKGFSILSGEDSLAAGFLAHGADGCISVTANCAPALCAELQNSWREKNLVRFAEIQNLLAPLNKALFVETSPAPAKYACSLLGHCEDEMRLPLLPASTTARKVISEAMHFAGLLSVESSVKKAHG